MSQENHSFGGIGKTISPHSLDQHAADSGSFEVHEHFFKDNDRRTSANSSFPGETDSFDVSKAHDTSCPSQFHIFGGDQSEEHFYTTKHMAERMSYSSFGHIHKNHNSGNVALGYGYSDYIWESKKDTSINTYCPILSVLDNARRTSPNISFPGETDSFNVLKTHNSSQFHSFGGGKIEEYQDIMASLAANTRSFKLVSIIADSHSCLDVNNSWEILSQSCSRRDKHGLPSSMLYICHNQVSQVSQQLPMKHMAERLSYSSFGHIHTSYNRRDVPFGDGCSDYIWESKKGTSKNNYWSILSVLDFKVLNDLSSLDESVKIK